MSPNQRQIFLSKKLSKIVDTEVASGRYASADEVVDEALRLQRQRDTDEAAYKKRVREEIRIGFEQAERGELVSLDDVMKELEADYRGSR